MATTAAEYNPTLTLDWMAAELELADLPADLPAAEWAAAVLSMALVDSIVLELGDAGRLDREAVGRLHDARFAVAWPMLLERLDRQRPHIARVVRASLAQLVAAG